ncbi:pyruvate kinase [Acetilactobacillus jinshanensis]|uniref:Pyruvate kinase n=1 Tax=Acetilactobacillus jinshanensis TaxID=1720083 RepID=A0A4P6ZJS9_9LACO|nr:pyruvate kinase [Acetilactobacillus jinshanensis]QBP18001.1 pyruvate kinase [Acetilactobacillus jinshanensis]URL60863.1 pyruvate kinase [uncultured bacterium]
MKKTKIVSTLGPASFTVPKIAKLIKAGANVFRFNFSHGSHPEHLKRYKMVVQAEKQTGMTVGIDCDTKGAEIRTTANKDGKNFTYHPGDTFNIAMDPDGKKETTKDLVQSTYDGLFGDVHIGGHVLFDDGILDTICISKDSSKRQLHVKVQNTATLGSRKTADIPGAIVHLPGVTEKDENDIRFACENMHINFITASFLRKPQDVRDIRKILKDEHMEDVQIFPKLENQEGIDNLLPIMKLADGVMVPRGDMAVNIPFENVPLVQKHMIHVCNRLGKPVITATQMEASMAKNPRPSRAEVSDVADAVFDGTDATMLSGETANGDWPVHAVASMARIDEKAESAYDKYAYSRPEFKNGDVTEAIGHTVTILAKDLGIHTIVCVTESGYTARMISKYRPDADILAMTFDDRVRRGLTINWGVQPILVNRPNNANELFEEASNKAVETGLAKEGDMILIVGGAPAAQKGTTNLVKVQLIGSKMTQGQGIGDKAIIGKAFLANNAKEANQKAFKGGILVAKDTNKDYLPAIKKASALVVENGGLTSYAAVVGISMNIPVIVEATDATKHIKDGDLITVDARRGVVYHGASK